MGESPVRDHSNGFVRNSLKTKEKSKLKLAGKMLLGATGATIGVALTVSSPVQAATFLVTNLDDNGPGSLRQAVLDANAYLGADVIQFQSGLTGTITLTTGQLEITDSVQINGPGQDLLAISGANASRIFYLYSGSSLIDVTISGLTLTEGAASIGGAIVNFDENLLLDAVKMTGNHAAGDGGALWADGFNFGMTVRNCTISGNSANDDGGGVYIEDTGTLVLFEDTVISNNTAGQHGGGVYLYDPDHDVTFNRCTISGNIATGKGGGIYLYDTDGGVFTISNCTISGNSAQHGGGVYLYGPDNPVLIQNTTISGNTATGSGGGMFLYNLSSAGLLNSTIAGNTAGVDGGGVHLHSSSLRVENAVIGNNTAPSAPDINGNGSFDLSYTLVEDPSGANIVDSGDNLFSVDPKLGPLANNGGPTLTHALLAGSPAIDSGDPAFTPPPAEDQRGKPRVQRGRLDMGAFETSPDQTPILLLLLDGTEPGGQDGRR